MTYFYSPAPCLVFFSPRNKYTEESASGWLNDQLKCHLHLEYWDTEYHGGNEDDLNAPQPSPSVCHI